MDTVIDASELLRSYADERNEAAFRELVARYVDLVYSAALRQMRDRHLAEDVVQTVFCALACKAGSLPRDVVLGGWLYRHTCFVSSQVLRTERRRAAREMRAMATRPSNDERREPDWEALAPALEAAMDSLGAPERDAIVLRYFERRELQSVGAALGVSEEAARKRVSRGIEKLRAFFAGRGMMLSADGLATLMAAHAVVDAPAGLATSAAGIALAGGGATAGAGGIAVAVILRGLAIMKAKAALSTAIVIVVLGGAAIPLVLSDRRAGTPPQTSPATPTSAFSSPATSPLATSSSAAVETPLSQDYPRAFWHFAGYATPEDAFLTLFWALSNDDVRTAIGSLGPTALAEKMGGGVPAPGGLSHDFRNTAGFTIVGLKAVAPDQVVLRIEVTGGVEPDTKTQSLATMIQTPRGWKLDRFVAAP